MTRTTALILIASLGACSSLKNENERPEAAFAGAAGFSGEADAMAGAVGMAGRAQAGASGTDAGAAGSVNGGAGGVTTLGGGAGVETTGGVAGDTSWGAGGVAGGTTSGAGGVAGDTTWAGAGSGGGETKGTPQAPRAVQESGLYGGLLAFSCVEIVNIAELDTVRYTLTTDGSKPPLPDDTSATLTRDANRICDLNQNATTNIALIAVDPAGHESPVASYRYELDTKPPTIVSVAHSQEGTAYPDFDIHFSLQSELGGQAEVKFGKSGFLLVDDGTLGDSVAGDGVYEGEFTVTEGDDTDASQVTGYFWDAAGNPASPVTAATPLTIDTIGTVVSDTFISTDQTWTAADNPYLIEKDAIVTREGSLSIEPGVVMIFRNGADLLLRGEVSFVGTSESPIRCTGKGNFVVVPLETQITYGASDEYVTGPRFEHLDCPHTDLTLVADYSSSPSLIPGAYLRFSTIRDLVARYPSKLGGTIRGDVYGMFVGQSYVSTAVGEWLEERTYDINWDASRLYDSYINRLTVHWASRQYSLTHCSVPLFEISGFGLYGLVEHNTFEEIRWKNPKDTPKLRYNNIVAKPGWHTFVVSESAVTAPTIDARENYWGVEATAQMQAKGAASNIDVISDFYDDFDQARVDYSSWSTVPYADAGPDW